MFTGLIEDTGEVLAIQPLPRRSGHRIRLGAPLLREALPLGASLAVDGVCLTVVSWHSGSVELDVGPETMSRTTLSDLTIGRRVHLERALRLSDRLGGHLVAGHVDGLGSIRQSTPRGDAWDVVVGCEAALLRYVIEKGSIALDGISLTVNRVDEVSLSVSLVPHTQQKVLLHTKTVGQTVNVEVDLIGKYVERLCGGRLGEASAAAPALTLDKLKETGFA